MVPNLMQIYFLFFLPSPRTLLSKHIEKIINLSIVSFNLTRPKPIELENLFSSPHIGLASPGRPLLDLPLISLICLLNRNVYIQGVCVCVCVCECVQCRC